MILMFKNFLFARTRISVLLLITAFFFACSPSAKIGRQANQILSDSSLYAAHVGISIYDPAKKKYLYEHQGEKFFVPASNTKLFTMYAGMKYLGDSIVGLRYYDADTAIFILPTGDPGFLHPDYSGQPVLDFLKASGKPLYIDASHWTSTALGSGWSWGDYNASYAPERSPFPAWGNLIRWVKEKAAPTGDNDIAPTVSIYSVPEVNWPVRFDPQNRGRFYVQRDQINNEFTIREGADSSADQFVPFVTNGIRSTLELLEENFGLKIGLGTLPARAATSAIHSRHTDSLLKPLMHRSDNLYAEQVMMMVGEKLFGEISERRGIDTVMKADLVALRDNIRWADGSGLSKSNFFTPRSMIFILDRMENEFGIDRVKGIMATGGEGTIRNFYHKQKGAIYAKTGTLAGVVALSGYLYTKKGRLLLFSVLVNNHRADATAIRRQVEGFIDHVYNIY